MVMGMHWVLDAWANGVVSSEISEQEVELIADLIECVWMQFWGLQVAPVLPKLQTF